MMLTRHPDRITDAQLIKMSLKCGTNCMEFQVLKSGLFFPVLKGSSEVNFKMQQSYLFRILKPTLLLHIAFRTHSSVWNPASSYPSSAAPKHTTQLCSLLPHQCNTLFSQSPISRVHFNRKATCITYTQMPKLKIIIFSKSSLFIIFDDGFWQVNRTITEDGSQYSNHLHVWVVCKLWAYTHNTHHVCTHDTIYKCGKKRKKMGWG